jgi:hypothetical protein
VFEVEDKVDYAEIEVFYPAEGRNHSPGGPKGWNVTHRCEMSPGDEAETPNWFYYYWQACGEPDRVEYDATSRISYYCPYDGAREIGRIFISTDAAPIGAGTAYLFVLREDGTATN